ncbi:SURF1 family protein [Staphylococcus chromogenes]|nr:SURF1 family protein [Staphylococcus chromogenes]
MSPTSHPQAKPNLFKAFLKPGWIATVLLILGFTYFAFTVLAPWQLHKNTALTERNHLIEESFKSDPRPYSEVFHADGTLPKDHEYQRVSVTGHFLSDKEAVLRVRPVEAGPAYHALTPFQITNGPTVLVNRGWQRPDDGKIPSSFTPAPTDEVTIVAYARPSEPKPTNGPIHDQGRLQVHGINTAEISQATGTELAPDILQLAADQPGVLTPFPLPKLDAGPHLSYGIQWIAFGIMAPVGLGYFVWAELRERRREAAEVAELEAANAPQPEQQAPEVSASARVRSRYGDKATDRARWARHEEERF